MLVFSAEEVDLARAAAQVEVVRVDPGELTLTTVLRRLRAEHGVRSLLCEGGPTLFGALIREGVVDELFLTIAPKLTGGGRGPTISSGPELQAPAALGLEWALERHGSLYLRYGGADPRPRDRALRTVHNLFRLPRRRGWKNVAMGSPHCSGAGADEGAGGRRAAGGARRGRSRWSPRVSDADLERVHSPLMSPLVWDLGHIAAFEDLWLVHRYGGRPLLRDDLADVYDAFETPRAGRGELPFLAPGQARDVPRPRCAPARSR